MEESTQTYDPQRIIQTVFRDTTVVTELDLDNDSCITIHQNAFAKKYYAELINKPFKYSKVIAVFIERQICQEEQQIIRDITKIENIREVLRTKNSFSIIYRSVLPQDDKHIYSIIKIIKMGEEKEPHKAIIIFEKYDNEIQKQIMYRKNLNHARHNAEIAEMSKTSFLFNMSHDLRTPMNAIMGLTDIAKRHVSDSNRVRECLEKIAFASDNLLSLINDILDMTRLETGAIQSEIEPANIKQIITHIIEMIEPTAKMNGKSILCEFNNLVHTNLKIDVLHLGQVMMNLIDNAIKYSDPGAAVNVSVEENNTTDEDNAYYTIKVSNTGNGIDPEFLPKIFEPFTRQRNSTMSGIQGTGLGLSITKKLVELMNGMIEVDSVPKKEIVFTIKLSFPINKAKKEARKLEDIKRDIKHKTDLTKFKVLLVEDNELNREIAKDILIDNNIQVEVAENGEIAVSIMKKAKPGEFNAVFMDIQMPVMDGYTATRKIRSMPQYSPDKLPIIALTANAFEEDKNRCFSVGMNDHIAKPVSSKKLIETLKKYC